MDKVALKSAVESLLFVSSKPLSAKILAKELGQDLPDVKSALNELVEERKNSGIVVLDNNGEYQLSTSSENSEWVKNFMNSELREKLTDATVEVLGIIAYRQPISKAELEAIRGVNSQYSIRHLLMRGMIEKIANPSDSRSSLYQTTTEFLMHLGLSSINELPEFEKLVAQIKLPETPSLTNSAMNTQDQNENEQALDDSLKNEPAESDKAENEASVDDNEGKEDSEVTEE